MDSKPSFYPKHLAKQYTVGIWSDHEAGRAMRQQVGGDQVAPAPFVNGRNRTPVGNAGSSGANSNEVSPNSSSGSMDSSYMDHHGSKGFRQPGKKVLQGLPDSFIYSMKRLFTLLDVDNTGLVHIEEIAENWSQDAVGSVLPPNIVPSLRKVANPEGYLTFERFCAGLKIAILRHSAQRHRQDLDSETTKSSVDNSEGSLESSSPLSRTNSLPNLQGVPGSLASSSAILIREPSPTPSDPGGINPNRLSLLPQPPPKPPRDPNRVSSCDLFKKGEFSGSTASLPAAVNIQPLSCTKAPEPEFIWKAPPSPYISQPNLHESKKGSKKYQESSSQSRRHTLQGGVDYVLVKSIDQWEQEKAVLEDGLDLLGRAEDWYKNKLDDVGKKLKLSHQQTPRISLSEANQERINFEVNTIRELNSRLQMLLNPNQRANGLAEAAGTSHQELVKRIERLQEQNRMLTDEVSRQSTRVTALEQDKRSLIKQLFQQSSSTNANANSISSNASTLRL